MTERVDEILEQLYREVAETALEEMHAFLGEWKTGSHEFLETLLHVQKGSARLTLFARDVAEGIQDKDQRVSLLRMALEHRVIEPSEFTDLTGKLPGDVAPYGTQDPKELSRSKKVVIEEKLSAGAILVLCDPKRGGVDVPEHFRAQEHLILRFGYGLTPAIPDLSTTEKSVVGTLTFGGVPHTCRLPYSAILAVQSDGETEWVAWEPLEKSSPIEDVKASEESPSRKPPAPKRSKRPSHLRLVE